MTGKEARIPSVCGILVLSFLALPAGAPVNDLSITIGNENARTAKVVIRKPFFVKLPVQFGTGYSWKITKLPKNVVVIDESVETPNSLLPGGQEYQVFKMKVELSTNEPVLFSLAQPFAPDRKPIRTFKLGVATSDL